MSPVPSSGSGNQAKLSALQKSAQPGAFERIFRKNYWQGADEKHGPYKWLEEVPSLYKFSINMQGDLPTPRILSKLAYETEMPFSIAGGKCVPELKQSQAFREDIARALEEMLTAKGLLECAKRANVRITAVLEKGGATVVVADFLFETGELSVKTAYGTLVLGLYSDEAAKQDADNAVRGLWYFLKDNGYRSHFDERNSSGTEMKKHRQGMLFETVRCEATAPRPAAGSVFGSPKE